VTRGQLPQIAGLVGLNGGGTAAAVPRREKNNTVTQSIRDILVIFRGTRPTTRYQN